MPTATLVAALGLLLIGAAWQHGARHQERDRHLFMHSLPSWALSGVRTAHVGVLYDKGWRLHHLHALTDLRMQHGDPDVLPGPLEDLLDAAIHGHLPGRADEHVAWVAYLVDPQHHVRHRLRNPAMPDGHADTGRALASAKRWSSRVGPVAPWVAAAGLTLPEAVTALAADRLPDADTLRMMAILRGIPMPSCSVTPSRARRLRAAAWLRVSRYLSVLDPDVDARMTLAFWSATR